MEGNSTACLQDELLTIFSESELHKTLREQVWRVNALLMANAVLMGVVVGIGAYGQRYRHHPLTRFLFLGANALFLPIVSYVVSASTTNTNRYYVGITANNVIVTARCFQRIHASLVLVWTCLVQIVGINTSAVVATDDREGRSIPPSTVLLVQAIWASYLCISITVPLIRYFPQISTLGIMLPVVIFAKSLFKCYAFFMARRSFALGINPQLIARYMGQLPDVGQHGELLYEHLPPPLLVMGEETLHVDMKLHGHHLEGMSNQGDRAMVTNKRLVTLDKIWQMDGMLMSPVTHAKDVCLSFALFKLLRCRFARHAVEVKCAMIHKFLWQVLLKESDDERILKVITDELCFLHDYYYSSLAISYSKSWLPAVSIFISFLSISYCIFGFVAVSKFGVDGLFYGQVTCTLPCRNRYLLSSFGNLWFDMVAVFVLLALVVLAEARDIASYMCSNWTKVALICSYVVNHNTRQRSPVRTKWVGYLLQLKCKMVKPWKDKMNMCSILMLHPRKTPIVLLRRLIPLPEQTKNVNVPRVVKATIIEKLRSNGGHLSVNISDMLLWEYYSDQGTSANLLVWHIATSLIEVRHPTASSDSKVVATHLSCYCAYLVTYSPELLLNDDGWSKSLYKAVKKDAERALASRPMVLTPEEKYQQLVRLLSEKCKHDVIKNGVRLAEKLVEVNHGEEEAIWKVLADFWSEMILYIAPSDNLDGHAEAIARGGELITLLWALLTHAGMVTTPSTDGATAAA